MEKERRYFAANELRAVMEGERKPVIEGHAAVFNQPSAEIFSFSPGWREIIRPGAFAKAIKSNDVRALINHDDNQLIGRVSNNTLTLEEDEIGLKVRIFPPDTNAARDLLTLIRGHYLSQMSFGFTVGEKGQRIDHANKIREITEVDRLYDVSPVTEPAYPQTDVGLRSIFQISDALVSTYEELKEEREKFLIEHAPAPDPLALREILRKHRV